MISHIFVPLFVVHLVLWTRLVVVSSEMSSGNDLADAGKYLEHHSENGSGVSPASRDYRAVRGAGVRASSESSSPRFRLRSCHSEFLFQCPDGKCISKTFLCDGVPDCSSGSDEICPESQSSNCAEQQFECDNGKCIPRLWHCDGMDDCHDNSDERGCKINCPYNEFKCRSGKCVAASSLCDGEKDCEGGEDEDHCGKGHCSSISGLYQCDSGDCVSPNKVCDNKTDCKDGTDEGLACASTCKAINCTEGCYRTPKGPHCSCRNGFSLQRDLVTCADENECEREYMLACDHFCENTNGSFRCYCHNSYTLQQDGVTCKHKGPGDAFLLVAQQGSIRQLFLDGSRFTQIYSGGNRSVVGLAFDPVTKQVFWGTRRKIMAADLAENSLPRTVFDKGLIMVEGLAVDWIARNLYIADPRKFHILVCKLDRSACYRLLTNLGHPRTIQLDMAHRYIYWTDVKNSSISKAGMDGSHPMTLVQDGLVWPNGLALDLPADRLYWLDAQTNKAHSARLDGTDRKTLHLATINHPFSLALWEDRLYWTDWIQSHIVSCVKRNCKHVKTELKGTQRQYFGLLLYHPSMMETSSPINNPCSYDRCSHLCLLSPISPGYTCACPTGVMQLDRDNHTCIDLPDRVYMIVNSQRKMYLVSPHKVGPSDQHPWMSNLQIGEIGDVEYFPGQDLVFVSDQYNAMIYSVDMKTNAATILVNNTVARNMAVDWLRHNLYWLDSNFKVEVMRLIAGKGSHRTAVITGLSSPLDIAVDPFAGLLFVSSANSGPQTQARIELCGLDGRHCYHLVTTEIKEPVTLAVNHKHNHLYWCDSSLGRIERINFNGTERTLILSSPLVFPRASHAVSLMIIGDSLSWTMRHQRTVYTMRTDYFPNEAIVMTELDFDPREASMLKLARVKWELPKEITEKQRPCHNNGGCSDICVGSRLQREVCLCGFSSILGSDGKTCEKLQCRIDQFQCVGSSKCIPITWKCDRSPDCSDSSDEAGCPFSCKTNEHQCGTTDVCVNKSKMCDGKSDCDDGSDEGDSCLAMIHGHCSNDHLCDIHRCLPQSFVCDGHVDCTDESDESNCTHISCPVGKVKCRRGGCVSKFWVCDGDKDCRDGSDEENCTVACLTGQYPCDKKCISLNATCDGKKDCEDGKDEVEWMCEARRTSVCPEGQIACLLDTPAADSMCFGRAEQCNGVLDCPHGEDESRHLCSHCKRNEFQCPTNNVCIPLSFLCDREVHCEDGADEGETANCSFVNTTTVTPQTSVSQGSKDYCGNDFQCEDGHCVPINTVCDGQRDCYDGSDEQVSCEVRCDTMNCDHICSSTPSKAYCSCVDGYHLAPNLHSCLDDEECMDEGRCSHGCEERPGSFLCTCLPGYELVDRMTCKREVGEDWLALAVDQGILNYTHTYRLQSASHYPPSITFTFASFSVNPVNGDLFFSDVHRQVVGKLTRLHDGVIKEEVLLRERSLPRSVSYDPQRRNLYVAEVFGRTKERRERSVGDGRNQGGKDSTTSDETLWSSIMACNLDHKGCSVVFGTNVSVVMSVAVAVTEKLLFFCTKYTYHEAGQLITSYLDGAEMKEIRKKVGWCSHIAVDEGKRRVYWTDIALEAVETVTWEGNGHQYVHRQQKVWFPVGLAVVGPNVLWVNRDSNILLHCPKLLGIGECNRTDFTSTLLGLFAAPLPFIPEQEECGNASCSQLCASDGSGCFCLVGYQRSTSDPSKCEKLTACNNHQCEGGSICEAHTAEHYVCRCPEGRYGLRCQFRESISEDTNITITASLVVVVMMVVLLLAFLYWWKRCPFTIWKRRGRRSGEQGYHFVNPAFGVVHDQPIIEAEAQPARSNSAYPRPPQYRPPPYAPPPRSSSLIQNVVDNPTTKLKESQINTSGDSAVASTTDSVLASQHSEVNLSTPFFQYTTPLEDERHLSEFDYSPFNPSKV